MKVLVTILYSGLLAWGVAVALRQIWQGFKRPADLLNPLFSNRIAIVLFAIHIAVVSLYLFVVGPWAVQNKSTLWYWGGLVLTMTSSLPIAAYFNRNPQSFGKLIGRWVAVRNFFEFGLFVWLAAADVDWFWYSVLLWWLVAYRYLDVGPRRALQKLYDSPAKLAARPWAPVLNWAAIAGLYVLTFVVVHNEWVLYADVPNDGREVHLPESWEIAVVVGTNLGLALLTWKLVRRYTDSIGHRQPVEGIGAALDPPGQLVGRIDRTHL